MYSGELKSTVMKRNIRGCVMHSVGNTPLSEMARAQWGMTCAVG